ncbi:MAG: hypothetical protein AAGE84_04880 [Cyanobacteria bacterium P01_G01_bin.39]
MISSPDVEYFCNLIASLKIDDIEHLLYLCKIYFPENIPIATHLPSYLVNTLKQINQLDSDKRELLVVFLEGFAEGVQQQNSEQSIISQNTFIVGGQSTINNHVVSQTNSTNLAFNFEPSLFAQAIERGLIGKSDMKIMMDIISRSLENQSNKTQEQQNPEQN